MLEADLFSLAQWAGQTVAASAISDAWDSARHKAARLLGRGDPKREQLANEVTQTLRLRLSPDPAGKK
jgi:hypothetical protein